MSREISNALEIARRVEDVWTDCGRDSMFARTWMVFVGWALTAVWKPVVDRDEVFMVARVLVARVADEHTLFDEFELEGFVLSALKRSVR